MAQVPRDDTLVVENGRWPLLVVAMPPVVTAETMTAFVAAIEAAYQRNERFGVIVDTSRVVKFPTPPAREVLSNWVADPRRVERERQFTVATAVVLTSGPLRALTAAINLVRRSASPQHWTATFAEADDWVTRRLADAGIRLGVRQTAPPDASAR